MTDPTGPERPEAPDSPADPESGSPTRPIPTRSAGQAAETAESGTSATMPLRREQTAPATAPATPPPPGGFSRRTGLVLIGVALAAVIALIAVLVLRPAADDTAAPPDPKPVSEPPGPTTPVGHPSAGESTSAAALLGWGEPSRVDEFDGPTPAGWALYNGVGHAGNGRRTPSAISVSDGILTIRGDEKGNTGGMALYPGQMYGRWEGRVRMPDSDPTYHALLLLWPDAEDWPQGGEVDFMEATAGDRQNVSFFLHYGRNNSQDEGSVAVDGTQWHNWAVEWTPNHVVAYLDGQEWYRNENKSHLPPRPMHLTIQLDWFPGDGDRNRVRPSEMQVDWIKEYKLN